MARKPSFLYCFKSDNLKRGSGFFWASICSKLEETKARWSISEKQAEASSQYVSRNQAEEGKRAAGSEGQPLLTNRPHAVTACASANKKSRRFLEVAKREE